MTWLLPGRVGASPHTDPAGPGFGKQRYPEPSKWDREAVKDSEAFTPGGEEQPLERSKGDWATGSRPGSKPGVHLHDEDCQEQRADRKGPAGAPASSRVTPSSPGGFGGFKALGEGGA